MISLSCKSVECTSDADCPCLSTDPEDESAQHAALRETMEEVGISNIDILGKYSIVPNKHRNLRVHPFVGYIRDPVDVSKIKYNPDEVAGVFALSLEYLTDPSIREMRTFRDSNYKYPVFKTPEEVDVREIWGLTSFIMNGKVCWQSIANVTCLILIISS